jgi:hypothetical protein
MFEIFQDINDDKDWWTHEVLQTSWGTSYVHVTVCTCCTVVLVSRPILFVSISVLSFSGQLRKPNTMLACVQLWSGRSDADVFGKTVPNLSVWLQH